MEYGKHDYSLDGIYSQLIRTAKQKQRGELNRLYGNDWRKHETNIIDANIAYYENKARELYEFLGE